jgi:hypothetical protein
VSPPRLWGILPLLLLLRKPPIAAAPVKADLNTRDRLGKRFPILAKSTMRKPAKYSIHINGTAENTLQLV